MFVLTWALQVRLTQGGSKPFLVIAHGSVLAVQLVDRTLRRVFAQDCSSGIAGNDVQQDEGRDRDADNDKDGGYEPPSCVRAIDSCRGLRDHASQTFSRRYAPPGFTAKPFTLLDVALMYGG